MERRFLRRLLLPTLLIMLCIQVFAAQEQSAVPMRIDPEPGFTTCIEDTDGNTITRNGVPNTNALAEFGHAAQIDSYSIYYNGRLLMTVTPRRLLCAGYRCDEHRRNACVQRIL